MGHVRIKLLECLGDSFDHDFFYLLFLAMMTSARHFRLLRENSTIYIDALTSDGFVFGRR